MFSKTYLEFIQTTDFRKQADNKASRLAFDQYCRNANMN